MEYGLVLYDLMMIKSFSFFSREAAARKLNLNKTSHWINRVETQRKLLPMSSELFTIALTGN